MNRKTLLKRLRAMGYTGAADLAAIKTWLAEEGVDALASDAAGKNIINLDDVWSKTVTISVTADAGEDVQISDGSSEASAASYGEDEEEMPPTPKRANAAQIMKHYNGGGSPLSAKNWQNINKRAAYTAAAKSGRAFGGKPCVYPDGDRAEMATAAMRLAAFGKSSNAAIVDAYAKWKAHDEEIVGKAGTIGNNATYGSTVIEDIAPELIENLNSHGAARMVATVTPMSRDSLSMHRWGSDVTVVDTAEGAQGTVTDGSTDRVSLYAKKTMAIGKLSAELLNDSSIQIANKWADSVLRVMSKYEDNSYFRGVGRAVGLAQTAGANAGATYDNGALNSSTSWAGWTIAALQAAKAKIAPWATEDGSLAIVAHPAFYEAVLKVNAYSAGGTPGDAILNGTRVKAWDGVPFIPCNIMPSSYSADQIVAYYGNFAKATKFGVVRGSEQIATSDDFYFDTDEVALRFTQRWDYNLHDVTDASTDGPGVIAFKD